MKIEEKIDEVVDIENFTKVNAYKNASITEKNKMLMDIIATSISQLDKKVENSVVDDKYLLTKKGKKSSKESEVFVPLDIDCSQLENVSLEDMTHILPKESDLLFDKKINYIKAYLRKILDNYDVMIYSIVDDSEMKEYLLECRNEVEEKLEFVNNYIIKEEIQIEKQESIDIVYFKYHGKTTFLNDLLSDDLEKYPSYSILIESLRNQTYKGIKRLTNRSYNFNVFEVRNKEQRVVFDFLTPKTIIIIQGFTKKVMLNKKYHYNLRTRLAKYGEEKELIKSKMREDYINFLEEYKSEEDVIMKLLESKGKKLEKGGNFGG